MRKCLFIFLILVLVSGAYGQELKFMGGPIISNYSEQWPTSGIWFWACSANLNPFINHKTGFLAGFGVEFSLNKNIGLELDGLYFQKGSTFENRLPIFISTKDIYNLHGFSFPVLMKIKFLPRPFPYILAGVEVSMILSHSRTILFWAERERRYREISRENLMESTKKVDFGPVLGIGFEAKISKAVFFIEGRYNLGVSDLLKSWYYSYRPDIKTCTLQIMAGFKI